MSILKPAIGAGSEFLAMLRSHANQQYTNFKILVGCEMGNEDVQHAVHELQHAFPQLQIVLVDCPNASEGSNGKVEVLEILASHARNPVLVISDADIQVPENYLEQISQDLAEPKTGLVTCLFRAEPGHSLASRFEALWINTEYCGQILLASWLQSVRFALGASIAIHSETLQDIGGFKSLRKFVGEDYQLGARVAALGTKVKISTLPIKSQLPINENWQASWKRQLRWSRTIRKQRPLGHAGLFFTFSTVWAGASLLCQPNRLWPMAAAVFGLRTLVAASNSRVLGSPFWLKHLWRLPLVDCLACFVWICSYFGSSVEWAERRLHLGTGGRIIKTQHTHISTDDP